MPVTLILKSVGTLLIFVGIFVAVSLLARANESLVIDMVRGGSVLGALGFTLLTALFVVFVIPLDIVFLIPLGVVAWGPNLTALMSISGWVLGSAVAFAVARSFGAPAVEKLIGLTRVQAIEARIPQKHLFWSVVGLRLLVSVDILSYALGLFSRIGWGRYLLATAIGVTPFGFYFSYAGTLPFWYQLAALTAAFVLATVVLLRYGIVREP